MEGTLIDYWQPENSCIAYQEKVPNPVSPLNLTILYGIVSTFFHSTFLPRNGQENA